MKTLSKWSSLWTWLLLCCYSACLLLEIPAPGLGSKQVGDIVRNKAPGTPHSTVDSLGAWHPALPLLKLLYPSSEYCRNLGNFNYSLPLVWRLWLSAGSLTEEWISCSSLPVAPPAVTVGTIGKLLCGSCEDLALSLAVDYPGPQLPCVLYIPLQKKVTMNERIGHKAISEVYLHKL